MALTYQMHTQPIDFYRDERVFIGDQGCYNEEESVIVATTDEPLYKLQKRKLKFVDGMSIEPHGNDVLLGRGGKNNQHLGNEKLRSIARKYCYQYSISKKKGKSDISRLLVQKMRSLDPPTRFVSVAIRLGFSSMKRMYSYKNTFATRFLKRNPYSNDWEDVGDASAREKISQVLRDAVAAHGDVQGEYEVYASSPADPQVSSFSFDGFTGLHAVSTDSYPAPSPVLSRYKRPRYDSQRSLQEAAFLPPPVDSRCLQRRHSGSSAYPVILRPAHLQGNDSRCNSNATTGSGMLGGFTETEFDLFDGQLLDGVGETKGPEESVAESL
jgi:hypothetical protein